MLEWSDSPLPWWLQQPEREKGADSLGGTAPFIGPLPSVGPFRIGSPSGGPFSARLVGGREDCILTRYENILKSYIIRIDHAT